MPRSSDSLQTVQGIFYAFQHTEEDTSKREGVLKTIDLLLCKHALRLSNTSRSLHTRRTIYGKIVELARFCKIQTGIPWTFDQICEARTLGLPKAILDKFEYDPETFSATSLPGPPRRSGSDPEHGLDMKQSKSFLQSRTQKFAHRNRSVYVVILEVEAIKEMATDTDYTLSDNLRIEVFIYTLIHRYSLSKRQDDGTFQTWTVKALLLALKDTWRTHQEGAPARHRNFDTFWRTGAEHIKREWMHQYENISTELFESEALPLHDPVEAEWRFSKLRAIYNSIAGSDDSTSLNSSPQREISAPIPSPITPSSELDSLRGTPDSLSEFTEPSRGKRSRKARFSGSYSEQTFNFEKSKKAPDQIVVDSETDDLDVAVQPKKRSRYISSSAWPTEAFYENVIDFTMSQDSKVTATGPLVPLVKSSRAIEAAHLFKPSPAFTSHVYTGLEDPTASIGEPDKTFAPSSKSDKEQQARANQAGVFSFDRTFHPEYSDTQVDAIESGFKELRKDLRDAIQAFFTRIKLGPKDESPDISDARLEELCKHCWGREWLEVFKRLRDTYNLMPSLDTLLALSSAYLDSHVFAQVYALGGVSKTVKGFDMTSLFKRAIAYANTQPEFRQTIIQHDAQALSKHLQFVLTPYLQALSNTAAAKRLLDPLVYSGVWSESFQQQMTQVFEKAIGLKIQMVASAHEYRTFWPEHGTSFSSEDMSFFYPTKDQPTGLQVAYTIHSGLKVKYLIGQKEHEDVEIKAEIISQSAAFSA